MLGNLDMTLASRLTSALHSGDLASSTRTTTTTTTSWKKKKLQIFKSSMALLQIQAILCGLLAGILAMIVTQDRLPFNESFHFLAAVVITSSVSAFVFGLLTFSLVLGGDHIGCNPDNCATPIVSSLGDLASLVLLAAIATFLDFLAPYTPTILFVPVLALLILLLALPIFWWEASKDSACKEALSAGWCPIILSLCVAQFAGMALETSIVSYEGVGIFVLFINGFGGNLGCVYASRMCSVLHATHGEMIESLFNIGLLFSIISKEISAYFGRYYFSFLHTFDTHFC